MNTIALAFMSRKLNQQIGLRCEAFGLRVSAFSFLTLALFVSNSKQPFGFTSGLNIGKLESLKCATNFRLNKQNSGLAKVYNGCK
jgi:hypothetical protein